MVKVLFTNTNCSINKGSAAQVISACETLRKMIPNLEITLISRLPELDSKLCKIHDIRVIDNSWIRILSNNKFSPLYYYSIHLIFNMLFAFLFKWGLNPEYVPNPLVKEYLSADAIIDLSGDSFSDDDKYSSSMNIDASILLAVSFGKPVIIYSQSIGPFLGIITASLAKYCLSKANLITVREEISNDYLKRLDIKSPVYLTADCAFLLNYAPDYRVKEILSHEGINHIKPLIGISTNFMLDDKENKYANTMSQLTDYIIEKFNADVIFIPHAVSGEIGGKNDDRIIGKKIFKLSRNKDKIHLIKGDYSPEELKGIIRLCDIFIGGRMHANIAAISSCIPTMATAWSHKYYGISRAAGLERYVCDYRTINYKDLKSMIDELWQHKALIQREMRPKVEEQKRLAQYSAELVRDLLILKD